MWGYQIFYILVMLQDIFSINKFYVNGNIKNKGTKYTGLKKQP